VQQQTEVNHTAYTNLRFMEGMDTGNLEYLEFVVRAIPAKTGSYSYFASVLQIFTEPIPRVLWPNKPVGEPIRFFDLFDIGNPIGMTYSLPGQGWSDLGWAGVALWCGLFGGIWGWFHNQFARRSITGLRVIVYMTLLPLSILFFRDGGAITMLRFGLFLTIPLLVFGGLTWLFRVQSLEPAMAIVPAGSGARRRALRAAGQDGRGYGVGRENRRRLASQVTEF